MGEHDTARTPMDGSRPDIGRVSVTAKRAVDPRAMPPGVPPPAAPRQAGAPTSVPST
ncbi:hypothetical protein [Streptosporangium oxazolinicum]|uniref:hypothetical protein n=1 Tax=Streptosporangium oxazolinicum TaxID=909287 RepID=UPI0031ED5997